MKFINWTLIAVCAFTFFVNLQGILLHGPLPRATEMAALSAAFLLICVAYRVPRRPFITMLVISLTAFPGALLFVLFLANTGILGSMSEQGFVALNAAVRGSTAAGATGLLVLLVWGAVKALHRAGQRHVEEINK